MDKGCTVLEPVKLWGLPAGFLDVLVNTIEELHIENKVIVLEYGLEYLPQISVDEIRSIEAALPNVTFVSADQLVWEQRMIKTDWEIDLIKLMCERAGRVLAKGWKSIRPGITERDIQRLIWEEFVKEDMYDSPCISNVTLFLCGSDSPGEWRLVTTPFYDRIIREGDQGFADSGPTYKGYWTDFQRSFYVGNKLPAKLADLSKWGLSENDQTELRPGMVICVEVGCFGSDMVYFGNMPEDMWLVTEKGLELLGIDLPRDICSCG